MLTPPARGFFSALTLAAATLTVLSGCQAGGGDAVVGTEEAVLTHAPREASGGRRGLHVLDVRERSHYQHAQPGKILF